MCRLDDVVDLRRHMGGAKSATCPSGHRNGYIFAMSLEAEMLARIREGVVHHNATCPMPARAILLNSGNYELFGWTELFGLPIEPRDDVPPKRFRIDCPGSAWGIEDEIADAVGEELPAPALPTHHASSK